MIHSDLDEDCSEIKQCRICHSSKLQIILDLGFQPLANALREINDKSKEKKFPLVLIRCNKCTSIQLSVNVNPKLMFQDYLWVTGTSNTAREHCARIAKAICELTNPNPAILEIGSNDGTLLKAFREISNGDLYGVDPATEISNSIRATDIRIVTKFFTSHFAEGFRSEFGSVDVVVARNVLSHVPDLLDVMRGIDLVLGQHGIFVVEFHEAAKIMSEIHYDSIYHEHTFYHSIRSMSEAQKSVGLIPFDLMKSPISGGSYILISSREVREPSIRLIKAMENEDLLGVQSESAWMKFAAEAKINLSSIQDFLSSASDKKIKAFGASARSSTLMNAIGPPALALNEIADNNPLKWGKLSPGLARLINSPKEVIDDSVDVVFICPFNFEDEIVAYLQNELGWHGQVFLPLPGKPRIYSI